MKYNIENQYSKVFLTLLLLCSATDWLFSQDVIWQRVSGPSIYISVIAIASEKNLYLGLGSPVGDIAYTTNSGEYWKHIGACGDAMNCLMRTSDGSLLAGTWYDGVIKSNDHGASWKFKLWYPDPTRFDILLCVYSMITHPSGLIFERDDRLGIQRSTDHGETWSNAANGHYFRYYGTLAVNELGDIYASNKEDIYSSSNRGQAWSYVSSTPNAARKLLAFRDDHLIAATFSGEIYRSSDFGISWAKVYYDSLKTMINDMTIDGYGNIYVATQGKGILRSTDKGISWNHENKGLTNLNVTSLAVLNGRIIYAGTADWLFRCDISTTDYRYKDDHAVEVFYLSQNHPNPFSHSTSIGYRLQASGHVRLEVFDLLGRKVATLVDEEKEAGEHTAILNIGDWKLDFRPGVYFYRLQSGHTVLQKKMIVLQ